MFPSRRATLGGDVFRDEFSVSFDGTDEYIELAGDFNHTNHAIVCWVQVNASSTSAHIYKNGSTTLKYNEASGKYILLSGAYEAG